MFTGNKDTDIKVLSYLNDKDLCSIFQINKSISLLDKNEMFWMNRVWQKYGTFLKSLQTVKEKYLNGKTWKEYYCIYNNTYLSSTSFLWGTCISAYRNRNNQEIGLIYWMNKKNEIIEIDHYLKPNCKHGLQEKWENGLKTYEGNYKDGKKYGKQITWDRGKKISENNFIDGKLHGLQEKWYMNGKQEQICYYNSGLLDGIVFSWFANGQLQTFRVFSNSILLSDLKWDENGNERFILDYDDYILKGGTLLRCT